MNINRHNYEEFFLMYVDNELSADDRLDVEKFIAENPDLATELDLLAQATLQPEPVSFTGKDNLLKEESVSVEEMQQMLMMLDGELDANQSNKLNREIQTRPAMQEEWNILQKTKLDPADLIEHPDKASLYHHSTGRLVSMRFLRVAVAAAVLAFGIYTGISLVENKQSEEPSVAQNTEPSGQQGNNHDSINNGNPLNSPENVNTSDNQLASNESGSGNPNGVESPNNSSSADRMAANGTNTTNNKTNPASSPAPLLSNPADNKADIRNLAATPMKGIRNIQANPPAVSRERENQSASIIGQIAANSVPEKNSSPESNISNTSGVSPLNRTLSPERSQPNLIADNRPAEKKDVKPLSALDTDIMQPLTVPDARVAAMSPAEDKDPNDVLFLDESRVRKSKLNGFFRKVKRTIERNANIKTGNGVKVAGFEIAVR